MSVQDIEQAVLKLDSSAFRQFVEWLEDYQSDLWDKQIESDAKAGRLDELIAEANAEFESGNCKAVLKN